MKTLHTELRKFCLFVIAFVASFVTCITSCCIANTWQNNVRNVEYKCSRCGMQIMRGPQQGRPDPGRCPRNGYKRHSWTVNRKFYHAGAAPKRKYSIIEYKCKFCGVQRTMGVGNGKPEPGRCQRRSGSLPHSWIINRKW